MMTTPFQNSDLFLKKLESINLLQFVKSKETNRENYFDKVEKTCYLIFFESKKISFQNFQQREEVIDRLN